MKQLEVKLSIIGTVKMPQKGDQYGDYGLGGRPGYWTEPIRRVTKTQIVLESGVKVSLRKYFAKELLNLHASSRRTEIYWKAI